MKLSRPNIILLVLSIVVLLSVMQMNTMNTAYSNAFNSSVNILSGSDTSVMLLEDSKDALLIAEIEYRSYLSSKDIVHRNNFLRNIYDVLYNFDSIATLNENAQPGLRKQVSNKINLAEAISFLKNMADSLLVSAELNDPGRNMRQVFTQLPYAPVADTLPANYYNFTVDTVLMMPAAERKTFIKKLKALFIKNEQKENVTQHKKGDAVTVEQQNAALKRRDSLRVSTSLNNAKKYYQDVIDRQLLLRKEIDAQEKALAETSLNIIKIIEEKVEELLKELRIAEQQNKLDAAKTIQQAQDQKNSVLLISFAVIGFTVLLLIYNIERARRYEKNIVEARMQAEKMALLKERFLNNMSHEIRTPLTAIIGFTEQLEKHEQDDEAQKHLQAIRVSSDHLLRTVNEILDFSKLDADKIQFAREPFLLQKLLKEVISVFTLQAEKKHLDLTLSCNFNETYAVTGDAFRLKQVLYNLIGNAIKFTDRGGVVLTAGITGADKNPEMKISVSDTGVGIPEEQLNFIFEEFAQVIMKDVRTRRTVVGTGLGLAICRMLVEKQGGNISVKSRLHEGSDFTIKIPYQPATKKVEEPMLSDAMTLCQVTTLEGKRVLVAEDDDLTKLLITTLLRKYKLNFEIAHDAEIALRLFNNNDYHIVLTDINLPRFTGYELAAEIRKNENSQKAAIPVIAVTANVISEDFEMYYSYGINNVITKPFKEDEFIAMITHYLKEI